MKRISVAAVLLGALIMVAGGAEPGTPPTCGDRGLLLTVSVAAVRGAPEGEVQAPLTLTIANTTQDPIRLPSGFTYGRYDEDAKMCVIGSGTFIICQKEGGGYLNFKGGYVKVSGAGQTLEAGEQITAFTIDLAKCFDFTPGKYDVQLLFTKRYSGFIDGASNRITVDVQ